MKTMSIGFDVGGTNTKCVQQIGDEGPRVSFEVATLKNPEELFRKVLEKVLRADISLIGVALPGIVRDGLVIESANLPSWVGVDIEILVLRLFLGRERKPKVVIVNDLIAHTRSAAQLIGSSSDLLCVALGTGMGVGHLHGGRILSDIPGGGEIGHMRAYAGYDLPLNEWVQGLLCGCGSRGCVERVLCEKAPDSADPFDVALFRSIVLANALTPLRYMYAAHTIALCGGRAQQWTTPDRVRMLENALNQQYFANNKRLHVPARVVAVDDVYNGARGALLCAAGPAR